ncbi:DUF4381 domain-containing protein [Rhodobacteraceae bacterium M382]|nr:DUF4381 domain-containing protein [Rhodobacteraceae bacterium M382]
MTQIPDTDGKNLVELLDMLEPIPVPDPISMWPATQAWTWLGAVVLGMALWGAWRVFQRWQANAYRRAALAELVQVGDDPAAIAAVLRRVALVAFPRKQVAALVGAEWLAFLDQTCDGAGFASATGAALVRAPYTDEQSDPNLKSLARHWIRFHRTGGPS